METTFSWIPDAVYVLVNDAHLVRNRNELVSMLNLDKGTREQLGILFAIGAMTSTEYFTKILETWVGIDGSATGIARLCEILTKGNFVSAAESMRIHSGSCIVHATSDSINKSSSSLIGDPKVRTKVVEVLSNDHSLVRHWKKFCSVLELPMVETIQWEQQYKMGSLTPYSLMNHILSLWASRKSTGANVDVLCEILGNNNFRELRGQVLAKVNTSEKNKDT